MFNEAERSVWIFWLGSIKIGLAKIRFKVIGTPSGRHGQRSFPFRTEYCKPLNFIILLEKSISPLIPSTKTQPNWLNLYWRSILIYRAPFLNRYSERIWTHCIVLNKGGFQLEFVSISRVIIHMTWYKFECSLTRFALQSECCNFNQWEQWNYNKSCDL